MHLQLLLGVNSWIIGRRDACCRISAVQTPTRADDRVTQDDVLRQITQAGATVRSDVGGPELKGVNYQDDDEIAAVFGETDYEMGFRDLDKDNGVDNSLERRRRGWSTTQSQMIRITRLFKIKCVLKNRVPFFNPEVAPKSALQDALSRLQSEHLSTDMTHSPSIC